MTIKYKGQRHGPLRDDNTDTISASEMFIFPFDGGESPVALQNDPLYTANVPVKYSQHPENTTLYAQNISIDAEGGDGVVSAAYVVTVDYTTNIKRNNALSGGSLNAEDKTGTVVPWKLPPYNISIHPIERTVPFILAYQLGDIIGRPTHDVLNPAGDPYDAVTVEQNTIIQFSYNIQDFGTSWIRSYKDTVNNSDIVVIGQSIESGKARIKNLSSTKQKLLDTDGTTLLYEYWKVDVEIEERQVTWKQEILARGLFFRIGGDPTKTVRIYTDNDGHFGAQDDAGFTAGKEVIPVDEPQKLAANGNLLSKSATPDDPVYEIFFDKFYTNWKPLSFPLTTR